MRASDTKKSVFFLHINEGENKVKMYIFSVPKNHLWWFFLCWQLSYLKFKVSLSQKN